MKEKVRLFKELGAQRGAGLANKPSAVKTGVVSSGPLPQSSGRSSSLHRGVQGGRHTTELRTSLSNPAQCRFCARQFLEGELGVEILWEGDGGSCLVRGRVSQATMHFPPPHKLMRLVQERGLPQCIIIATIINNLYLMRLN